jgi:hypothetical protein
MEMTLCPRCGGHATRCECAELRREGMLMAADDLDWIANGVRGTLIGKHAPTIQTCAERIRALARKPEPL